MDTKEKMIKAAVACIDKATVPSAKIGSGELAGVAIAAIVVAVGVAIIDKIEDAE